jgi:hypothetical protein
MISPTRLLAAAALFGLFAMPAAAQDMSPWFLDLAGGIGIGRAISPRYYDLVGSQFTTNRTIGDQVLPHSVINSNTSPAASVAAGRFLTDNFYLKASYRYFGAYRVSGSATYLPPIPPPGAPPGNPTDIQQSQYSTATGAFLTIGGTYDLAERIYLEASGDIGASFIHSAASMTPAFPPVRSRSRKNGAPIWRAAPAVASATASCPTSI